MSETVERRPSFLRTGLGCFIAALTAVATLLTVGGVWAYFALRDVEPLGDFDPDVPDIDFDALLGPEAGQLTALDAATGEERWTRRFGYGTLPVGISGDVVLVHQRNNDLAAVDAATGAIRWRRSSSSRPVLSGTTVVIVGKHRSLIALDAATGAERWRLPGVLDRYALLIAGGGEAVFEHRRGELTAVDLASGAVRWTAQLELRGADPLSGIAFDDLVILRVGADVVAIETATGATRWTWDHPPVEQGDDLYLSLLEAPISSGPTVGLQILEPAQDDFPTTSTVFVDRTTGVEQWRTASGALSSFAFDGATLYEYGEDEQLLARDPLTGALRFEASSVGGRLLITPQALFVAGDEVSAVDPATGTIRWSDPVFGGENPTALGVSHDLVIVASKKFGRVGSGV